VGRRTQLLLAQLLWTVVGCGLFVLGLYWVVHRFGDPGLLYATPFLALGTVKAVFVLDGVAHKAIARIQRRGDGQALWSFFSGRSWALVLAMMVTGQLLRASPLPRADLGFLYVAAGSALLISSRSIWRVWWRDPIREKARV